MNTSPIPMQHIRALANVIRAVDQRGLIPVVCKDAVTGAPITALAAIQEDHNGTVKMVLLAKLFDNDPYKELMPPDFDVTTAPARN